MARPRIRDLHRRSIEPLFWSNLFQSIGPVDIVLDDGGHTNIQQIVTLQSSLDDIKDGGLLVIEDTHSSYLREFGNPSQYSFIQYAKRLVDHVSARFPQIEAPRHTFGDRISCITFFEAIVPFEVDRRLCIPSSPTFNGGISADAKDFRYDKSKTAQLVVAIDHRLAGLPLLWRLRAHLPRLLWLRAKLMGWRMRSLFR